jgi:hypothetical protein
MPTGYQFKRAADLLARLGVSPLIDVPNADRRPQANALYAVHETADGLLVHASPQAVPDDYFV